MAFLIDCFNNCLVNTYNNSLLIFARTDIGRVRFMTVWVVDDFSEGGLAKRLSFHIADSVENEAIKGQRSLEAVKMPIGYKTILRFQMTAVVFSSGDINTAVPVYL